MNKLYAVLRQNPSKHLRVNINARILLPFSSSSSGNNSDNNNDENRQKNKAKAESPEDDNKSKQALNKLNSLLKDMIAEDIVSSSQKLDLAKPKSRRGLAKQLNEADNKETVTVEPTEKQIVNAVKNVAESIGGNTKQTESELLMKLLNPVEAAQESNPVASLMDIVKGMSIDREIKPDTVSRAEQVRQLLQRANYNRSDNSGGGDPRTRRPRSAGPRRTQQQAVAVREKIDLFGSEPLGIFTGDLTNFSEGVINETWNNLYKRELKLTVTHPPSNYFQQMILWTEQGKVWKFPIDNEQDMKEEQDVYFAEHVFLDKYLEPWCPTKGPLRHFMELVCVGLSKNPYLSVGAKKEHIDWFKNYFEDKRQLLQEVGAFDDPKKVGKSTKSIESNN